MPKQVWSLVGGRIEGSEPRNRRYRESVGQISLSKPRHRTLCSGHGPERFSLWRSVTETIQHVDTQRVRPFVRLGNNSLDDSGMERMERLCSVPISGPSCYKSPVC